MWDLNEGAYSGAATHSLTDATFVRKMLEISLNFSLLSVLNICLGYEFQEKLYTIHMYQWSYGSVGSRFLAARILGGNKSVGADEISN